MRIEVNWVCALAGSSMLAAVASAAPQQGVAWQQIAKLVAPDGSEFDEFGCSLALDGDTLVVGAHQLVDGAGAAYVFVRSGSTWVHQQTLRPAAADAGYFGGSVAIDGDTIAVGAMLSGPPPYDGSAHVFTRSAGVWTERVKLAPAPQPFEDPMGFGSAVALDGGVLVVGCVNYGDVHDLGPGPGAAFVYRGAAASWTLEQRLDPASAALGFGATVHASHGLIFVHESSFFGLGSGPSRVHVFEHNALQWVQTANLAAPIHNFKYDGFGQSIDFDGSRLVASVSLPTSVAYTAPRRRGALTYLRSGGSWTLEQSLLSADLNQDGSGGAALDGDLVVTGSPLDDGAESDSGSATVYRLTGGLWQPRAQLAHANPSAHDWFGISMQLENGTLVVASAYDDDLGQDAGAVYVFSLQATVTPPTTFCTALVNSQGCTPLLATTGVPSMSSPTPFTLAASQVLNNKSGMYFYSLSGRNAVPFQGGTLCVAGPLRRTPLQASGGNPGADDCSGTLAFDFNAYAQAGGDPLLTTGMLVVGQFWHRDPAAAQGVGLSAGVEFELTP